jgi:hypothetical protein
MQEQNNDSPEENMGPRERAGQAGEVFSFQEVVYPPPRWKHVLFSMQHVLVSTFRFIWQRLLPATSQFILGIGVGLTLVWTMLVRGGSSDGFFTLLGLIVLSIPCIYLPKTRFFGFGLLVCIFVLPVIIAMSCTISRYHGTPVHS